MHGSTSGGIRRSTRLGWLSSAPTLSARVPMASYRMSRFLACESMREGEWGWGRGWVEVRGGGGVGGEWGRGVKEEWVRGGEVGWGWDEAARVALRRAWHAPQVKAAAHREHGTCVAWRGMAWRGVAWRGVAWRGVAC